MLIYEYKLDGSQAQYAAIDEAIRIVQFIRNKCLRLWMDERGISKNDLQRYCAVLAKAYAFANRLNSQARQASADRAWFAISRFYDNCKSHKSGKKGYPKFQHDNRSVEYKQTGWKLEPDGCSIGRLRLVGNPKQKIEAFPAKQIKRVRIVHRGDGYYAQFGVQAERQVVHMPTGKQVGIDVGLKAFYTDSEGNTVANPCHYRKAEKKLKRLHRQVSRKQKQSQNRKKARKHLARAYLKVQRQRGVCVHTSVMAVVSCSTVTTMPHSTSCSQHETVPWGTGKRASLSCKTLGDRRPPVTTEQSSPLRCLVEPRTPAYVYRGVSVVDISPK
jgi:putative transposase